jgi:hypothetical protein
MVSAKSIKAQMPHVTLARILGKPSHCQLKQPEHEFTTNLMALPCPWGQNKGLLGLLQDPVLYLQCNSAAFTIPAAALLAYPVIMAGATAKRKEQHANNISACKAWSTYMIFHTITWDQIAASINDVYYTTLNDPTEVSPYDSLSPTSALHARRSPNLITKTTSPISIKKLIPTFHLPSTHASRRSVNLLHRTQVCPSPRK